MSISAHPSTPKRRLGATFAVAGAALLTGAVVAFGPSIAHGNSASSGNQAEAFATCMRENGVPDFPGVTVTANGQLQLLGGGNVNPISKTYQAAAKKCASKLPSGSTLPAEPSLRSPSVPAPLTINCSGSGCPAAPEAPKAPALPN